MNESSTQPNNKNSDSSLAGAVLDRIETECIEPKARWRFLFSEYTMWSLWVLSVIVGAISVAVTLYVSVHAGYALYELTHDSWLEFLIESAPWLWLIAFIIMAVLGYINFSKTCKGYRYPMWQILMSSIFVSILGGSILHVYGAGHLIDSAMEKTMPMYPSMAKLEQQLWQRPQSGLLLGQMVEVDTASKTALFVDVKNREWELHLTELNDYEVMVLSSGDLVRVLGVMSTTSQDLFYGCGIFPWMHKPAIGMSDVRKERELFVRRMNDFKHRVNRKIEAMQQMHPASTSLSALEPTGLCPSMPVLKKMPL